MYLLQISGTILFIMDADTSTEELADTAMGQLIAQREELLAVPSVGDIVTGHILDKGHNTLYLDLGTYGIGVIYGR